MEVSLAISAIILRCTYQDWRQQSCSRPRLDRMADCEITFPIGVFCFLGVRPNPIACAVRSVPMLRAAHDNASPLASAGLVLLDRQLHAGLIRFLVDGDIQLSVDATC